MNETYRKSTIDQILVGGGKAFNYDATGGDMTLHADPGYEGTDDGTNKFLGGVTAIVAFYCAVATSFADGGTMVDPADGEAADSSNTGVVGPFIPGGRHATVKMTAGSGRVYCI